MEKLCERSVYTDLVQITFYQQSVLELMLFVAKSNITKSNTTLSCGLYENIK